MHPQDLLLALAVETAGVRHCWHAVWPWLRWLAATLLRRPSPAATQNVTNAQETFQRLARLAPIAAEWVRKCADGAERAGVARNFRGVAVLICDLLDELHETRNAMGREAKVIEALKKETSDAQAAQTKLEIERDLALAGAKDLQSQLTEARKQIADAQSLGAIKDEADLQAEAAELVRLGLDADGNAKPAAPAADPQPQDAKVA
jgi:uncharacterized phage infection (PIP) family protein YhgE